MPIRSWRDHLPAGSTFEVAQLTSRRSLPAAWAQVWGEAPRRPVLLDASTQRTSAGGRGTWVSAGEFDERTRAGAGRLWATGLVPGDRVLWSVRPSLAAVVANVAALRAGLVVVPANPGYRDREIAHIVADVTPAAAVVDTPERARTLRQMAPECRVLSAELEELDITTPRGRGSRIGPSGCGPFEMDAAGPDAPALVAYTSGTTGAPKGATLSHGNLLANSEAVAVTWRWEPRDRLVHALPIFHGHGLCVAIYTSLLVGASVVLLAGFDAEGVLGACHEHRASLFFGVPTQYFRLAASPRARELSRLRLAVSGSAPLSAELHGALRREAGTVVLERYGMTETLMTLSNPCDGERRAGSVGLPFPGVEVRLVDAAGCDVGADGVEGEILVKGPAVFGGYWRRPDATAAAFRDGWFCTGDVAELDDGYVRIRGRSHDMILSGGYNVYPAEVEDVLLGHAGVTEVAVTGTPSQEWGEVVTAWVVADGAAPAEEELLSYAADRLVSYKRPRLVHFVDSLPRNTMGKIVRSELR